MMVNDGMIQVPVRQSVFNTAAVRVAVCSISVRRVFFFKGEPSDQDISARTIASPLPSPLSVPRITTQPAVPHLGVDLRYHGQSN